jgi:hypothetical protein
MEECARHCICTGKSAKYRALLLINIKKKSLMSEEQR